MRTVFCVILILMITGPAAMFSKDRRVMVVKKAPRLGLVIGNADYNKSPLNNPVNDANDIADTLENCGFKVTLILNADQKTMEDAIRKFGKDLVGAGIGLFYFSGHGIQVNGSNYLIPVNSDIRIETDIKYKAVPADFILAQMDKPGNVMNVLVLDACRVNPFARSFRSPAKGLAYMDAPKGTLIAYATNPGQTAADGEGRNGVFTKHLLNRIKESDFEIMRLLKQVRKGVMVETGEKQIPWESSSLVGDFYFNYTSRRLTETNASIAKIEAQLNTLQEQNKLIQSEEKKRQDALQESELKAKLKAQKIEQEWLKKEEERKEEQKRRLQELNRKVDLRNDRVKARLAEEESLLEELKTKYKNELELRSIRNTHRSVSKAREELDLLENKIKEVTAEINLKKRKELQQHEIESQPIRNKLKQPLPPKGQFEKTPVYDLKIQKHKDALVTFENQYKSQYERIEKRFEREISIRTGIFIRQIEEIKKGKYLVDGLTVNLVEYNPDEEKYLVRFIAPSGNTWDRLFFIEPMKAKGLFKRKDALQVEGYYPSVPAAAKKVAPKGSEYYRVQRGDTLYRISRIFNVSTQSLIITNEISRENRIYIGQVLRIPRRSTAKPIKTAAKRSTPKPVKSTPAPESKPTPQPVTWGDAKNMYQIWLLDPVLGRIPLGLNQEGCRYLFRTRRFFDNQWNENGDFLNRYKLKTSGSDKVVIDRASALMWQPSGSKKVMTYNQAELWINDLNIKGYAGYKDWRLPKLEEGATLLERKKNKSGLHINHLFSKKQNWIWTDSRYGLDSVLVIGFLYGSADMIFKKDVSYVRAVRALTQEKGN